MAAHAVFAPSSSGGWGNCSAFIHANAGKVDIPTPEKRAGIATHWVGEQTLELHRGGKPSDVSRFLGRTDPDGTVIDDAMLEGAQIYVDEVLGVAAKHGMVTDLLVEKRIHMPQIHPENWGTFDSCLVVPRKKTVYLWDYKHGHLGVDPYNLQMVDYMAGVKNEFFEGVDDREITVVLRVVQPYSYSSSGPVKEWVGHMSEFRGDFNRLHGMAHEAYSGIPKMTAGKTQCRHCAARGKCATAREAAYLLVDSANEPYVIDNMSAADLAVEKTILDEGIGLLEERRDAIDADLFSRIKDKNEHVPGLALETSRGTLKWDVSPAEAIAFAAGFGLDISKEGVRTPTQAKAAISAEFKTAFEEVLPHFANRPAKGLKLVAASDTNAARAFKRKV